MRVKVINIISKALQERSDFMSPIPISKRIFDFLFAGIFLIPLFPICLIIALLIHLDSPGPILFRQERLGKDGQVFKILKFRTMIQDAEKVGTGIVSLDKDDRITSVGKILRSTSLDEIPQLWNVVRGDMSLVGPRPPAVYHPYDGYDNYPDWAKPRFQLLPGITGLSQLTVRNTAHWDERMRIDVHYVTKQSLALDISIIFKTVIQIFNPKLFIIESKGD